MEEVKMTLENLLRQANNLFSLETNDDAKLMNNKVAIYIYTRKMEGLSVGGGGIKPQKLISGARCLETCQS